MGNTVAYFINVYTGDRKNAGTNAKVSMVLHDDAGNSSETIHLDNTLRNDLERGELDVNEVFEAQTKSLDRRGQGQGKISKIQFWRDDAGLASGWYLEKVVVESKKTGAQFVFPVFRWVRPFYHYFIQHLDTSLPQADKYQQLREMELEEKRKTYKFTQKIPGLPVQVESMPPDEQFSSEHRWDLAARAVQLQASVVWKNIVTGPLKSISELNSLYDGSTFKVPRGVNRWKKDLYFGIQRTCGLVNRLIELCTTIPAKLPVTDAMLQPLLEGLTIQQALVQKRLFIVDMQMMERVSVTPGFVVCAPIGLFFLDKNGQLTPVAIQLYQTPTPDNPIFLPTDDPWLWEMVKMWYNNADGAYHESHVHLGFTHLVMEGVVIASHRNLSQSHPVFKLLAPHFLYLLTINANALQTLIAPGEWIDTYTNFGITGAFEIIRRGLATWRLDVHGTLPEDLKRRRLDDPNVLPCYHFRDDAMLYYDTIHKYVTAYLNLYYDSPEKLTGDWELQNWAAELVKPRDNDKGGCGLLGVPGEGSLTRTDQLAMILTSIIYTCSVEHAAVNFSQYDEYGFPPNSPLYLQGQPPKTKDPCTEADLVKALPDLNTTLNIMMVTNLLSQKATYSLGNFEVQYVFDPRALAVVDQFRQDLSKIGETIKKRNAERTFPYEDLEPSDIPNSISI
ncbi:hypothetical protein ACOMHN_065322 [Nucella lapillus]